MNLIRSFLPGHAMNAYDEVRQECCPAGWQPNEIGWDVLKQAMDNYANQHSPVEVTIFREYFGMNGRRRSAQSITDLLLFPSTAPFVRRPRYELDITSVETTIGVAVAFIRDQLAELLQVERQEHDTS